MIKKVLVVFVLMILLLLSVSACILSQQNDNVKTYPIEDLSTPTYMTSSEKGSAYNEDMQAIEDKVISTLVVDMPFTEIVISSSDGGDTLSMGVDIAVDSSITFFGVYVYELRKAFNAVVPKESQVAFAVSLRNNTGETIVVFISSNPYEYGNLSDYRGGTNKITEMAEDSDLANYFPALIAHMLEDTQDEDEIRIYREVMFALDNEPARSEEDIFSELAPNYNMTPEELMSFMHDMMEKIYSQH